ncbi:uncharacterized protein LOC102712351 [Oryza brachyantha]|uniref:Uncharacterized protein n=1 Tax=Oryza brachyantha TaxID=4533 RepID=J3LXA5_ORYBR|nr:uncharacterized protein LOC102712351 [Oryza brachyantha]
MDTGTFYVSFFDGTTGCTWRNDDGRLSRGDLHILFVTVTSGEWTESTPGKLGEAEGEIVLTIVPKVVKKSHMHRTFVSQIISQRSTCMNEYLKMVNTNLFSFTLPLRIHDVLGSSVFNMEGKWAGYVTHHPTTSAGMRFGMRGDDFQHTLPKWMGEKQWEDIIQPYVEHELYLESIFDWQ